MDKIVASKKLLQMIVSQTKTYHLN